MSNAEIRKTLVRQLIFFLDQLKKQSETIAVFKKQFTSVSISLPNLIFESLYCVLYNNKTTIIDTSTHLLFHDNFTKDSIPSKDLKNLLNNEIETLNVLEDGFSKHDLERYLESFENRWVNKFETHTE